MKKIWKLSIASLLIVILFQGCMDNETWEVEEQQQIQDYLKSLGDTVAVLKPSGLYYIEIITGTGEYPEDNDTVYFKYKGRFLSHWIFETNDPITVPFEYEIGSGGVIAGVDEGLRYMKAGGKAKILTPSKLAFGFDGVWQLIPGYTPLLWDLELDSIKRGN
jgi:FKBP-type peptidyl-prolyl cis-trans isomerase